MNYWIIAVHRNGFHYYNHDPLFTSPFQADVWLDANRRDSGEFTYDIRPATWQERERGLFEAGVYTQPVWHREEFWRTWCHRFTAHYTHVSLADPTTIAFTEDERKGEADRQTLMKPGKYLQKFFGDSGDGTIADGPLKGDSPVLTKQQVAYYAAWHKAGERPPNDDELHFTDEASEMIRVYRSGPYSCMRGCDKDWPDSDHPVQVYAAGDLQMAYLTRPDGTVAGRGLCWPAKNVFGRIYPTPNNNDEQKDYDELHNRLKELGWTSITERRSVFEGARLLRKTNGWGKTIMPYLDHEYGVESHLRDDGTWGWKMTHDANHQDRTDGLMADGDDDEDEDDDRWTCEHCDERQPEYGDQYSVYFGWRVRPGSRGYATSSEQWCESCRDSGDSFYCEGANEDFFDDGGNRIEASDGNSYHRGWFFANGGYQCSWSEEYFFQEDDPKIVLANGEFVSPDSLTDAAFRCLYDGQWWSKDWASEVVPGYSSIYDDVGHHPVEYEFTLPDMPVDPEDVEAWAKAYADPPHAYRPADPVVIDLAKSGLTFDPAIVAAFNTAVSTATFA